jgi:prephenate dehydrogenase
VTAAFGRGVLVVGAGLLGTSLGLALRRAGVVVHLADRDPDTLAAAAAREAGSPAPPPTTLDLAVVAVPPAATGRAVVELLESGVADYVTDVASVKVLPAREVAARAAAAARYVGGHPMAGREVSGPGAATVDLFRGRPWVLCPSEGSDPAAIAAVQALARTVGAQPVTMPADEHDAAVALVSHAPHLVASLVAARLEHAPEHEVGLAGQGVIDVTRVAAADPRLWTEILEANGAAVREVLAGLRADLDAALAALGETGAGALTGLLEAGVRGRSRLPGKHGGRPTAYVTVPVTVEDRPGQLAQLFADADAAGVNVEDVRIEHVQGIPTGVVEIAVRPGRDDDLARALRSRGWTVHR